MEASQSQTQASNRDVNSGDFSLLEEMEMEEITQEEALVKSANGNKRNASTNARSKHWEGYSVVMVAEGNPPQKVRKGKCTRCVTLIAADSRRNGTTSLKNHSASCLKKHETIANQSLLKYQPGHDGTGVLTSWKFDQYNSRLKLCEMIIRDELPFRFVQREGFKQFVDSLCPKFIIPCRKTVIHDCLKCFLEQKLSLKSIFQKKGLGRVSITSDCWTAANDTNYICVTAHYIDVNWNLKKRIISFRKICNHKGDAIGEAIIEVLEDWGLKNILCCTMDNASANDGAIRHIKSFLETVGSSILDGRYLHMRCVGHVLNLVVTAGIEEISVSVRHVREAVKWVKGSPSRIEQFKQTVKALKMNWTKNLCLDVPTGWNSTYLMLESAMSYDRAFKFFALDGGSNPEFVHDLNNKMHKNEPIRVPQNEDWVNVGAMCDYLERFYDFT